MLMLIFRPVRCAFATLFHYLLFFVNIIGYPAGLAAAPLQDTITAITVPTVKRLPTPAVPHGSDPKPTSTTSQTISDLPHVKIFSNVSAPTALQSMMLAISAKNVAKEVVRIVLSPYAPSTSHRYTYEFYTANGRNLPIPKRVAGLPVPEAFTARWLSGVFERSMTFLGAQVPLIARFACDPRGAFAELGYDPFVAFFGTPETFPRPRGVLADSSDANAAHPWMSDSVFAQQYLVGCNPSMIHRPTLSRGSRQATDRVPRAA